VSVTPISYAVEDWGVGEVWLDGPTLLWHELPRPAIGTRARARETHAQGGVAHPPPSGARLAAKRRRGSNAPAPEGRRLIHRFQSYFAGDMASFEDVQLDVDDWTPFQLDVLRALRRVPFGEVVSYGELARIAGHPHAQRAAGTFCAGNRFPIVVPCHRVVAADGIGSYGSLGLDYKRRLLDLEGVAV
jgi:methylated-DNA-[protein]-cysteine S-methyltransferase